jgi:hypothetical protein
VTALDFSVPPAPPEPNVWAGRPTVLVRDCDYIVTAGPPATLRVAVDQRLWSEDAFDPPPGAVAAWIFHLSGAVQAVDPSLPLVVDLARGMRRERRS